jgi:hypothetical protein
MTDQNKPKPTGNGWFGGGRSQAPINPNRKLWKEMLEEALARGQVPVPRQVKANTDDLQWKPHFSTSVEYKMRNNTAYRRQRLEIMGEQDEESWLRERGMLPTQVPGQGQDERTLPVGATGFDAYGRPIFPEATSQREYDDALAKSQLMEAEAVSKEQAGWDWDAPNIMESYEEGGFGGAASAVLAGGLELIDQGREAVEYKILGGDEEASAEWAKKWNTVEDKVFGTLSDFEDWVRPAVSTLYAANMLMAYGKPLKDITEEEITKHWSDFWKGEDVGAYTVNEQIGLLFSKDFWSEAYDEGYKISDVVYGNMWEQIVWWDQYTAADVQGKSVTMAKLAADHPETEWYTLSRDLSNPSGDLVGRMLFDPLNLVSAGLSIPVKGLRSVKGLAKVAKLTPRLAKLANVVGDTGKMGKLGDAVRGFVNMEGAAMRKISMVASKVDDVIGEGGKIDEVVQAFGKDYDDVVKARNTDAKPFKSVGDMVRRIGHWTITSKQKELGNNAMNVARWAADAVRKGDEIDPDAFYEVIKLIGDLADPAKRGSALRELSKHGNIYRLMTEEGMQGIEVISKAVDHYGGMAKKFAGAGEDLKGVKKMMAVVAAGDEFFMDMAERMYPTLNDVIKKSGKEALPFGVRSLNTVHNAWQATGGKFQRAVFGLTQLGLSPGYAVRNFVQNTVQSVLDEGLSVIVGHNKMDSAFDWLGITRNADGKLMTKLTGSDVADDWLLFLNDTSQTMKSFKPRKLGRFDMRNVSASIEKHGMRAIAGKVINDTMRKFMRETTSRLLENEFKVSRQQAKYIEKLLISNRGDVGKTFIQLHDEAKHGIRPLWGRNKMPSRFADDIFEWVGEDKYDEWMDTSKSADEAVDRMRAHQKEQDARAAEQAKKEVPIPGSPDTHADFRDEVSHPGQVADAKKEGIISSKTEEELHSAFSAMEDVTMEIDEAKLTLMRQFRMGLDGGNGGVLRKTDELWNEALDTVKIDMPEAMGGGTMTGREYAADTVKRLWGDKKRNLDVTWDEWIKEAEELKAGATPEELDALWKKAGMSGERGNKTAKDMYGEFIETKFQQKHKLANAYRDANVFGMMQYGDQMAEFALKAGFPEDRIWRTDVLMSKVNVANGVSMTFDKHLPWQMVKDTIVKGKRQLKKGMTLEGNHTLALAYARYFGLTSGATSSGAHMDKYILNILNTQLDRNFQHLSRLHNVSAKDIEKALLRHSMGLIGEAVETPANVRSVIQRMMSGAELTDDDLVVANGMMDMLEVVNPKMKDELTEKLARFDTLTEAEDEAKLMQEIDELTDRIVYEFNTISDLPAEPVTMAEEDWDKIAKRWAKLYPDQGKKYAQEGYNLRATTNAEKEAINAMDLSEEAISDAEQVQENIVRAKENVRQAQKAFDDAKEELEAAITEKIGVTEARQQQEQVIEDVVSKRHYEEPKKVYGGDTAPQSSRVWDESKKKRDKLYDELEDWIRDNWGKWEETPAGDNMDEYIANLEAMEQRMNDHIGVGRDVATQTAKNKVEFILHDYGNQKNYDTILGYIYPYSFWYTRTYANWIQRIVERPQLMNGYMNWKDKQASINSQLPEYMQSYTDLAPMLKAFGHDPEHPVMANLDSMLSPLYGLLGTDFDDPDKRGTQFATVMDNLGKFGPSIHQSYGMLYGLAQYLQGNEEAGDKWLGRFLGTGGRAARAVQPLLGISEDIGGTEIDPARIIAAVFEGRKWWQGMDPYEQGRTARELYAMSERGEVSEDQIADIADMDNPWDSPFFRTAIAGARSNRQAGDIFSYVGAPAFRTRSLGDIEADKIDAEFRKVYEMRDRVKEDVYAEMMAALYDKYPAADVMFLMRKSADERDAAFTYHVLRRIPPGATTEIYERVGLNGDDVREFYKTNGKSLEEMSEGQREEFMVGITSLSMALSTPEGATKQEWELASKSYKHIEEQLLENYGEDTKAMVDRYWILMKEDRAEAYAFSDKYPQVQQWLDDRTMMLNADPISRKYYASYGGGKSMFNSMKYDELERRFPGMKAMEQAYFDARATGKKVKAPEALKDYWKAKTALDEHYNNLLWTWGQRLDDGPEIEFRTDFPEEQLTQAAQDVMATPYDKAQVPEYYDWEWSQWANMMSPALQRVVSDWAYRGRPLSDSAESSLEYALGDLEIPLPLARDLIRQSLVEAGAEFYGPDNPPSEYGGP